MFKKSDIINILSVGLKLFLITAISACVLAVINNITAPIIEENTIKKQEIAMKSVVENAVRFEKADMSALALVDLQCAVTSVFNAVDSEDRTIGYAVMVSTGGYGGEILLTVGMDVDLKVTGVDIISHSETPGLGENCTKPQFKDQFKGKENGIEVVKNGASGNQIDAISSATITSKAVTAGVNCAITAVNIIKEAE